MEISFARRMSRLPRLLLRPSCLLFALVGLYWFAHRRTTTDPAASRLAALEVEWRVPVGCGYSGFWTEVALGFVPGLHARRLASPSDTPRVRLLSGECDGAFVNSLDPTDAAAYRACWVAERSRSRSQTARSIAIEHGEPCGMRRFGRAGRPLRLISRSMSEGDLADEAVGCLRSADEVWVPTAWHAARFTASGVSAAALHVVPEPVDTEFFSPQPGSTSAKCAGSSPCTGPFTFVSNFKWEARKGCERASLSSPYMREPHLPPHMQRTQIYLWQVGPTPRGILGRVRACGAGAARAQDVTAA